MVDFHQFVQHEVLLGTYSTRVIRIRIRIMKMIQGRSSRKGHLISAWQEDITMKNSSMRFSRGVIMSS